MIHLKPRRIILGISLLTLTLLLAGCFTTNLNLGSVADAKTDPAYVGDWHFTWKDGGKDGDKDKSADLILRDFNGKQYYVEWTEADEKPVRMSGFLIPIKDATFAQLTGLDSKPDDKDKNLILRVVLAGDKLTLRHLKGDFFKDVTTDAELRSKVEANVDNAAMYQEEMTGSKTSQP
jgi:hypothetical protein